MVVIGSRPAIGKTALALNIATNVAVRSNVPFVIFSLEISKELKSAHKSTKISDSSIKSKSSTSSLMKSILISSQKAHEIINSEERESTQNIHSLIPVTNKTLFNSEEEKRCNFPQNKTNKIIQGNDHNVKKLIKYNLSNVFNSISYKQTSLYDYFKK